MKSLYFLMKILLLSIGILFQSAQANSTPAGQDQRTGHRQRHPQRAASGVCRGRRRHRGLCLGNRRLARLRRLGADHPRDRRRVQLWPRASTRLQPRSAGTSSFSRHAAAVPTWRADERQSA